MVVYKILKYLFICLVTTLIIVQALYQLELFDVLSVSLSEKITIILKEINSFFNNK